ncbi:hypothetical protein DRF65_26465 [Chryseobacterium pennae]|uniref:Uncharacterized protein n=1 Tax=Chryseobacterium pennae TaxID=2258962 RepID=A0A3D9C0T7_9FLAO|nr:hypothetical protein DRF65_26465 [Chryseobacterium pennae]
MAGLNVEICSGTIKKMEEKDSIKIRIDKIYFCMLNKQFDILVRLQLLYFSIKKLQLTKREKIL